LIGIRSFKRMWIGVITLFPEMFEALNYGIPRKATSQSLSEIKLFNPRDFTEDNYKTIDGRPYGGGPGMVLMANPLSQAIKMAKALAPVKPRVIYVTPQGETLTQEKVRALSQQDALIIVSGRYEGIDERIIDTLVDEEVSIGDYVLSGGELPAMIIIDAVTRLIKGALGHALSAEQDSFSEGLLDCPHYTRPEVWQGHAVPDILLSGNHAAIEKWRKKQSIGRTFLRRPDLLKKRQLTKTELLLLNEFINEHTAGVNNE
jgi:tRNA (guanine37-N1)-methyltransferase